MEREEECEQPHARTGSKGVIYLLASLCLAPYIEQAVQDRQPYVIPLQRTPIKLCIGYYFNQDYLQTTVLSSMN